MNEHCLLVLVHKFYRDRWVELSHEWSRGVRRESTCGRLATKWHVQVIVHIRWRKCDQIIETTRTSNIERTCWDSRSDLRRKQRCRVAAKCNCRASDQGSSEHGDDIGPRVSGATPSEVASEDL